MDTFSVQTADVRRETNQKSLVHPLAFLAEDFRAHIRRGLHRRGYLLQAAQAKVLVHLDMEGTRLTDLASRAGISKQAMGKLVDELEKLGYVCRDSHSDRRAKTIQFTPQGLDLLKDSAATVEEVWQHYAAQFGEARLEKFRDELNALFAVIRHKGEGL